MDLHGSWSQWRQEATTSPRHPHARDTHIRTIFTIAFKPLQSPHFLPRGRCLAHRSGVSEVSKRSAMSP